MPLQGNVYHTYTTFVEYAHGAIDSLLNGSRNRHGPTDLIVYNDNLFFLLLFRLRMPFVTIHAGEATSQSEAPSLLTIPTLLLYKADCDTPYFFVH